MVEPPPRCIGRMKINAQQKITPFLWFNDTAEEAAKFYVSVFKGSKIEGVVRYGKASAKASGSGEGAVMIVRFRLDNQEFVALNGGPHFKFTEALSFVVNCKNQKEVDYFWEKLSVGGKKGQCGWLKDKYGLSWQVVPTAVIQMLNDADPGKSERVMEAVLRMDKIDLQTARQAYARD